jgi:ankyrin repeat protein
MFCIWKVKSVVKSNYKLIIFALIILICCIIYHKIYTTIYYINEIRLIRASRKCNIKKVKEILLKNIDINYQNSYGDTALNEAACYNCFNIVELLIKYGADVNIANNNKYSALMSASFNGNVKIVKLLLDKGARVDFQIDADSAYEYNALMIAVDNGHIEIVKILLDAGTDVNIVAYFSSYIPFIDNIEDNAKTALTIAREKKYKQIEELLINASAKELKEIVEDKN